VNLARHYRTLGLRRGASAREVKSAYRVLVRQYHPDINPDEAAVEQFLKINDAYTIVSASIQANKQRIESIPPVAEVAVNSKAVSERYAESGADVNDGIGGLDSRLQDIRSTLEKLGFNSFGEDLGAEEPDSCQPNARSASRSSEQEKALKQTTYEQLKGLLKHQKFPRAIALIEGLAHRMPQDAEIVQWQAIVYQRWGRQLIHEGQTHKARIYLKKALRTDPKNRALWKEVNRDFWQLASLGT